MWVSVFCVIRGVFTQHVLPNVFYCHLYDSVATTIYHCFTTQESSLVVKSM